jgi:hypothetical protein
LAAALLCAGLGFAQSATAATIAIAGGDGVFRGATLDCGDACIGFIGGGSTGEPDSIGTLLDDGLADRYRLSNSSPATETAALETLLGFDVGPATVLDIQSLSGFGSGALYFALKLGPNHAFFANASDTVGMILSLSTGRGAGLSHVTTWGVIPLPAALPMFLLALGGAALVARRRRGVTDEAA